MWAVPSHDPFLVLHLTFHSSAKNSPDKAAVVGHGRRLPYSALRREALRLAARLRSEGAVPGDRIAMLLPNATEAAVVVWAVLELGGVLVPLHAAARKPALQAVLRDAEPRWVISAGELSASFQTIREALPGLARLIVWSPRSLQDGILGWDFEVDAAQEVVPADVQQGQDPSPQADSLAALIYTSGSTGEPKGVMLTHAGMLAALRAVNAYLKLGPEDVLFSPLPLSSSYGLYQLLSSLWLGATVVLDRSFAFPVRSLQLAAQERATVFAGVPTMYAWIATAPTLPDLDLSALHTLTSAAASLPVEHARRVQERLPLARLFVMYGQTECKRISYLPPEDLGRKPGSVGRGMPFQEHRVVDDAGETVPPGATGELVVRGPHVMQGYWRQPEATARKLRRLPDGGAPWLHTDDLFRIDDEGYLYFVGRKDDLLKVGGHKVSPREIEDVLCQIEGVREAAVVGMPDALWGEAAKAFLVVREGVALNEDEVLRFCSQRLQGFMVPKAVVFVRDLPKTESGKVKKLDLR